MGTKSLRVNTTGTYNSSLGDSASGSNTTGSHNTSVGWRARPNGTTGGNNICIGGEAGEDMTTGSTNTLVGYLAGQNISTNGNNVCLGNQAGRSQGNINATLWIARDNSSVSNSTTWIHGTSSGACFQGNNSSSWSTTSDERIKKDIVDSPNGLAKIDAMQVRNFNYRTEEEITVEGLTGCDATGLQVGVIAQELELVLPHAVIENEHGLKQVNTDPIFWSMVKAIQELSTQNAALAARLTTLEEG